MTGMFPPGQVSQLNGCLASELLEEISNLIKEPRSEWAQFLLRSVC